MKIQDAAALITGGSRGLGEALALALVRQGARVGLVAREPHALQGVTDRIRRAGGVAVPIVADVGDKHAIHRIAGEASAALGSIDILVNGASTLGPTPLRMLLDTDCEDLERVLAVNLVGPFRLTKVILGNMVLRGRGIVINVSSDAAVAHYPNWGAYGLAKAALDQLTATWAAELPDLGVRLLSVDPGEMDTRMHAEAIPDADRSTLANPSLIARRIVDMIVDDSRAPNGARLVAPQWITTEASR